MSDIDTVTKTKPNLSIREKLNIIKGNRFVTIAIPFVLLLLIIVIFNPLTDNRFFSKNVLTGILNQGMIIATFAVGVSFIYTTGNLDISIGSAMALAATIGALLFNMTGSVFLMVVSSMVVGVALMLFNCTMSAIFRVRCITVAIVMMQIYSAIEAKILGAEELRVDLEICRQLENGGFRYIAFALFFILALVVFHFTKVGRALRFIGGNDECARQSGISSRKYIYISFLIAGLGVGLAAVFTIIRVSSISIETGSGMGIDVMLATVLGGMSIFGGAKSNSYAGLTGALIVSALNKGLLMIGVSVTIIQGIRGVIFLALVFLNSERQDTLPSRQQV